MVTGERKRLEENLPSRDGSGILSTPSESRTRTTKTSAKPTEVHFAPTALPTGGRGVLPWSSLETPVFPGLQESRHLRRLGKKPVRKVGLSERPVSSLSLGSRRTWDKEGALCGSEEEMGTESRVRGRGTGEKTSGSLRRGRSPTPGPPHPGPPPRTGRGDVGVLGGGPRVGRRFSSPVNRRSRSVHTWGLNPLSWRLRS